MHLKQLKAFIILSMSLLMFCSISNAQTVKQQGVGQVTYKGWSASAKVKQEAIEKAKKSAIEKYTATFTMSKMMNYEKIREKVESNLDNFITEYKIIDDDTDKGAKRYSVVIDAAINTIRLEVELQKVSTVQNTAEEDRALLSFVFVAREVVSQKTFDARKTKRVVEEKSIEEQEEAHVDGEQIGFASETLKDTTRTTGGSTLQKSDQLKYEVSNADDVNAAMTDIFSAAGYEVIEAVYLEDETDGLVSVDNFIEDYRYGDDISGQTRRSAAKGCRDVGIHYFAIGTLDVGAKDIDPVSGMTRVYVSVNGKIMSMKGRFPKTVAAVGPVQYAGMGPNQTVAKRNALRLAAGSAASDLTAKLQAKNIN